MKKIRLRKGSIAYYAKELIQLIAIIAVIIGFLIVFSAAAADDLKENEMAYATTQTDEYVKGNVKVAETGDFEPETADEWTSLDIEEMIQATCEEYGIDHELPLAIAKLETGHFTSRAYTEGNNVGGLSVDEVPLEYESLDEGVDAFIRLLAENYFAEGLTTLEAIGQKYCPVNPEWAEIVRGLM